jgi:hypothetical protein
MVISPRGRLWGILWLAVSLVLTLLTLPATLVQLQVLFAFERPFRVDYFVFIWALVPWAYRHPEAFRWLMPSTWPGVAHEILATAERWRVHWRQSPQATTVLLRRVTRTRVRAFLGIGTEEAT